MRSLALALTTLVGRLVVDKTGLTELYDFELTVDRQTMTRLTVENGGDSPRPQPAGLPEAPVRSASGIREFAAATCSVMGRRCSPSTAARAPLDRP